MRNKKIESETAMSLEVTKGPSLTVNLFDEEFGRMGTYSLQHTNHSQVRSQQRGISNLIITLAIEYGKVFHKQGLTFYVLGDKRLPKSIGRHLSRKIKKTVVVLGDDAQIVTCYKGTNLMKHVQRKQKYLAAA